MAAVKRDSRTCFGLAWYLTEEEAIEEGRKAREAGHTVNGGWLDGMACDRASEFDYDDPEMGCRLYAIRTR